MSADPYLQATGTLHNRLGITDADELQRRETAISTIRIAQLRLEQRLTGRFDLDHLRSLHRHIFRDIYEWAGHTRGEWTTIQGQRVLPAPGLLKGGSRFADGPMIEPFLNEVFRILAQRKGLRDLPRSTFAREAADLLGDLNAAHPFREGNGRTQREFLRQLAVAAGHPVKFSVVSQRRMVQASIASVGGNNEPLHHLLEEIGDQRVVRHLRAAEDALASRGLDWNARDIAMAQPGQAVSGTLLWKGEDVCAVDTARGVIVMPADALDSSITEGEDIEVAGE